MTGFLIVSLAVSLAGGVFALSLNSAMLWRSLPFDDAHSLMALQTKDKEGQNRWLSWRELESIATRPMSPFTSIAGFTAADFNALSEPGLSPEPLAATVVSADFFRSFGISAAVGRLPDGSSYGATAERVVVLTHHFWQRRYGADPGVVGRSMRMSPPEYLGGTESGYRIVGVLPEDAWLLWDRVDVVVPMRADLARLSDPSQGLFERVVGRIDQHATVASARAVTPPLIERLREVGHRRPASSMTIAPLQDTLFRDLRPQLRVVVWLAALVFLLAGLNVVIAFVAQETDQRRATAVRLAVGASYGRLAADMLRQHAITLVVAAAMALIIGQWLIAVVGPEMPDGWLSRIPGQMSALRVDAAVLAWLLAALTVMLAFSSGAGQIVLRRLKPWVVLASPGSEPSPSSRPWRSALVGVEIALCSAVVITSATLVSQLMSLRAVDLGIDDNRTSVVWVNLWSAALADDASRIDYYDRILRAASSLSGVEAAGGVDLPFHFDWQTVRVRDEPSVATAEIVALTRAATSGYPAASGLRLRNGRWFSDQDRAGREMVAVVSESLALARWPETSALGQQIISIDSENKQSSATVVGIVGDTRHAPHAPPDRVVYFPVAQAPPPWLYVMVRSLAGAADAVAPLKEAIWRINPDQPIDGPWTLSKWRDDRTVHLRFLTLISIVLGAVGVVLAAAGLYGMSAWTVASTRRSIAVRRAVGASNWQIGTWFIQRWLGIIVPGLAGGLILQSATTSMLIAAVEGLQQPSAVSVLWGILLMSAAAAVAVTVPLRRALTADSGALLRE